MIKFILCLVSSKFYRMINGKCEELGSAPPDSPLEGSFSTPSVIQDTMDPIKHPVTEEMIDSKSKYHRINRNLGLEVVGENDLLSNKPRTTKDYLPESKIMEAQYKAEAILSDPSKRRAYREAQAEKEYKIRNIMKDLVWG